MRGFFFIFVAVMRNFDLITILGPTACGKTKLAVALADRIGGEILSADSRQVYRGMDIGTLMLKWRYSLREGLPSRNTTHAATAFVP